MVLLQQILLWNKSALPMKRYHPMCLLDIFSFDLGVEWTSNYNKDKFSNSRTTLSFGPVTSKASILAFALKRMCQRTWTGYPSTQTCQFRGENAGLVEYPEGPERATSKPGTTPPPHPPLSPCSPQPNPPPTQAAQQQKTRSLPTPNSPPTPSVRPPAPTPSIMPPTHLQSSPTPSVPSSASPQRAVSQAMPKMHRLCKAPHPTRRDSTARLDDETQRLHDVSKAFGSANRVPLFPLKPPP